MALPVPNTQQVLAGGVYTPKELPTEPSQRRHEAMK